MKMICTYTGKCRDLSCPHKGEHEHEDAGDCDEVGCDREMEKQPDSRCIPALGAWDR